MGPPARALHASTAIRIECQAPPGGGQSAPGGVPSGPTAAPPERPTATRTMPEQSKEEIEAEQRNRREQARRGGDRRRPDRRAAAPLWRRPWAYAAYGVLAALVLVLLFNPGGDDEPEGDPTLTTTSGTPEVDTTRSVAATSPSREAMGAGEYERLVAEGEAAVGQRVTTHLYCEAVSSIALQSDAVVTESVAAVSDATGRVPGAECRWGEGADAPELLLLVPPALATTFAAAPEVQQSFIRRRSVRAEIEWIGRSEALALRNVAVLRAMR